MKLSKSLKEKFYDTLVYNIQEIRSKPLIKRINMETLLKYKADPEIVRMLIAGLIAEGADEKYILKENHQKFVEHIRQKYSYMDKIYSEKTFPASLRDYVFLRDNYRCQTCGISKDVAMARGLRLKVGHKVPWSKGGKTCYDNGKTICSRCTKEKF
ncbi:HNH endonuclease signature motif containing protein [Leptospira licerasiae]|uniref:HNH endonuclease n=1 Tax=Leptospira licerasiae TaxID=447106 RepID=UPI00301A5D62